MFLSPPDKEKKRIFLKKKKKRRGAKQVARRLKREGKVNSPYIELLAVYSASPQTD